MGDLASFLLSTELLSGASERTIRTIIIPAGTNLKYPEGKTLYEPQDRVDDFIILLSGKVSLINYLENGNRDLREQLYAGTVVAIDLLATKTRVSPYLAQAAKDSEVFTFPCHLILESGRITEAERNILLLNYLRILSRINMKKEYRLAILTHQRLRERIMIYLMMQSKRLKSRSFTIPFTRDEMASFLCVNRSALSHELGSLKAEGIIDFRKNRFTLNTEDNDSLSFE